MLNVILFRPLIPPNTGNVIRLCANTGCDLHLVRPLGFALDDARMRRAGLDYRERVKVNVHDSLDDALKTIGTGTLYILTTSGTAPFHSAGFKMNDTLLFGNEEEGLPDEVRKSVPPEHQLRIPMLPESRCLNLSNSVAITVYFALDRAGALRYMS